MLIYFETHCDYTHTGLLGMPRMKILGVHEPMPRMKVLGLHYVLMVPRQ